MSITDIILVSLACWYMSYSVVKLSGPFGAFTWLRTKGELFTCIYCVSLYVAIGFALIWLTPARPLVYPFALAGLALQMHRFTGGMLT